MADKSPSSNIAESKQVEAELRALNATLEQRVAERTAQLEDANQALKDEIVGRKQAQETLRESEQRYSAIFDTSPFAIALTKMPEGTTVNVNDAFLKLFEVTRAEVVGKTSAELGISDSDSQAQVAAELQARGKVRHYEATRTTKSGARRVLSLNLDWVSIGEEKHVLTMINDVTERKQAEEQFRLVVEASPNAIILVSIEGQISLVNEQTEALFGYGREELLGQPIEMLVPPQFRAHHNDYRDGFLSAPTTRPMGAGRDLFGLRKDGSQVPVEIGLNPITTPKGDFVLASIIDITERKQAEEERAESLRREQVARVEAEAAQQRLAFLVEASNTLASSLDYHTTLATVAQLAVPRIADWSAVDVVEPDGTLQRVALVHTDPAKVQLAYELQRRYPPDPDAPRGVYHVLRTGQAEFYPEISEGLLEAAGLNEEQLNLVRELDLKSAITMPILVRDRALGAITLVSAESDRHYDEADLALTEELASRAALAIDNARLYSASQRLNTELEQRVIERTAELQAANANLIREIADRKQAVEQLQESEARFRVILEGAATGISLTDLEGRVFENNPALQKLLGYSRDELHQMSFTEFTHPADVQMDNILFQELMAGKRDQYQLEKRFVRKDGQIVWGHLTVSLVRGSNREPLFAIAMTKDISERKQIEAELAEVRHRLIDSREAERLHLAQELHDGPLQDLHGASFRLGEIEPSLPDETSLGQLVATQATLQQVIQTLRAICGELRPPTLAPFGLEKAIRSYAETFQKANPELNIELDLMPDGQLLSEQLRLALFRICQQSLNNVRQHAEATQVKIRFGMDSEQVFLEIEDNGCGFEVPKRRVELARQGHLGLVGAAERAEAIGGQLKIVSAPEEGTLIKVVVPRRKK